MTREELRQIGFVYQPEALTPAEQLDLVQSVDGEGRWEQDYERLAQRHGYRYEYKSKTLVHIGPLAPWVQAWADAVVERGWMSAPAQQITAQCYGPGTGIGDHCDCRRCFGPEIVTISLLATGTYRFLDPITKRLHTEVLEPGGVVVLSGAARSRWKHGISKSSANRIIRRRLSVTFRTINAERVRPASS